MKNKRLVSPRKLAIFEEVITQQSITGAARRLNLTQPAVSNVLRQLEEHFDAKLFEVIGKRPVASSIGLTLIRQWQSIKTLYQKMDEEMRGQQLGDRGIVRIAMVSTAIHIIPSLIKEFQRDHVGVSFECHVAHRDSVIQSVLDFSVDIGILTNPPHNPDLFRKFLGENVMCFISSPSHHLRQKKEIIFPDICDELFIVREYEARITQALYEYFNRYNKEPKIALKIDSTEAIKEAVMHDMGIALVPELAVERELKSKALERLNLSSAVIKNDWYLVSFKNKYHEKLIDNFNQSAMDFFDNL